MIQASSRTLLARLLEGELTDRTRMAFQQAIEDPETVEWREATNTLEVTLDKVAGSVEIIDLLDASEAGRQVLPLMELRGALANLR